MIELIIFLIIKTRLGITFAISLVSRFIKNVSHQYIEAIKTIFKYFKSSIHQKIIYKKSKELKIKDYSDLDWAGDKKS